MADAPDKPGITPQPTPTQQVSKANTSQNTFRAKWQENWLRRLRSLPEPTYRQCIARLQRGEPADSVAVWLLSLPNRGGLQNIASVRTLEKYV